ncbi:MAG TPA: hypothetical protein VK969_08100 [Acidimicrobiia bacterium]|nr:hypothetical protein [Acidimicrobiia bacterium]
MAATERDKGATAILLAMVLFLLVGVAAVAIDLARGWTERRQDQTSVDIAAVAGALSFDTNETTIASQVMTTARMNLDTVYSDAEWNGLWTSCAGAPPSGFVPVTHSSLGTLDCIALNPSYLWVKLPEQIVEASFGKALGVDQLTTGAEATVTLLGDSGKGALPFAVRGNAGTGEVCLDTGTGKVEPPCDGNESGSFGNIAPPLFGNPQLGTSPSCKNQTSSNNHVADSIAMGMDHVIWTFSESDWKATGWDPDDNASNKAVDEKTNVDECIDTGGDIAQAADGMPINAVYVDTGNSTKTDVTEGMMTGTGFADGDAARLTRSTNTRLVDGIGLDNTALWEHLLDVSKHGINECNGTVINKMSDIADKNDAMRGCLDLYEKKYTSGWGPIIFSDSIVDTPRVGVAPRLWHNNLGSGLSFRPVWRFDVIYIHGLWFDDKQKTVFYPDDGTASLTIKKFKDIEQVTAYLLRDDMLSKEAHDELGGFANDTWQPTIYE